MCVIHAVIWFVICVWRIIATLTGELRKSYLIGPKFIHHGFLTFYSYIFISCHKNDFWCFINVLFNFCLGLPCKRNNYCTTGMVSFSPKLVSFSVRPLAWMRYLVSLRLGKHLFLKWMTQNITVFCKHSKHYLLHCEQCAVTREGFKSADWFPLVLFRFVRGRQLWDL